MSGEKIPYHLRQNKHVERQLFIEVLSHLGRVKPISEYAYVSFGGVFFEDFKVIHSQFGTDFMISLEKLKWIYERQEFNVPYDGIVCKHTDSKAFIADLATRRADLTDDRSILCWLDYASAKQLRSQLEEIRALLPKLEALDVLKFTINANPATLWEGEDAPRTTTPEINEKRLVKLREKLGDMLGEGPQPAEMSPERYPNVLLKVIERAIAEAMAESGGLIFQPLANFAYNDQMHTMLTCVGVVLGEGGRDSFLRRSGIRKFPFNSLNWQLFKINVPYLSPREKFWLDKRIKKAPADVAGELTFQFDKDADVSQTMIEEYIRFHRYYPHYHRIQY